MYEQEIYERQKKIEELQKALTQDGVDIETIEKELNYFKQELADFIQKQADWNEEQAKWNQWQKEQQEKLYENSKKLNDSKKDNGSSSLFLIGLGLFGLAFITKKKR